MKNANSVRKVEKMQKHNYLQPINNTDKGNNIGGQKYQIKCERIEANGRDNTTQSPIS